MQRWFWNVSLSLFLANPLYALSQEASSNTTITPALVDTPPLTSTLDATLPATTQPAMTTTDTPTHNGIPDCIQRDAEGRFMGWLDGQHCLLSNRASVTAQWFDSLFGSWYGPKDAKIRLRVIEGYTWDENAGTHGVLNLRVAAVLPNAKRRLRLVISDDEDTLHRTQRPDNVPKTTAAIRWLPDIVSKVTYTFDIGFHSTPDVFVRARARRIWHLDDNSIMRFSETLRYGVKEEGRSLTQLDVEHLFSPKNVFLLANAFQYWQNDPKPMGWRWGQDWIILHRMALQKTLSYGVSLQGAQEPAWHKESSALFMLYRQSFLRSWLYYEIEPRLTRYYADPEKGNNTVPSVTLRLEAQFGR